MIHKIYLYCLQEGTRSANINTDIVFKYADWYSWQDIDLLELIIEIHGEVGSAENIQSES